MKRLIILLTALLPILLMGCVKDDAESIRRDGDGVTFSAETYGSLTQFSFETGDKIGVYMKKTGLPLATANIVSGVSDYSYVYDVNRFKPDTGVTSILIPEGEKVDFVAYSPRITGTVSNFVYSINVSDQSVPDKIDILYSDNATKKEKVFRDVKLVFKHKLSKIHLDITGDLTAAQKATVANATVVGVPTQGALNLTTGATSTVLASVANFNMYEKVKGGEYEAIVIPHDGAGYSGRKVTLTADGIIYNAIIPNDHNFKENFAYTYELFIGVGNTEAKLTLKHVVPWGLNEEIDFTREITPYFTDPIFKQWVFDNCCGGRESIFVGDVVGVSDVDLSGETPKTIGSLAGIEFFSSLENLIAPNQNITTIDLSKSLFAKTIDLKNNELLDIDVTNNYSLEFLDVSYDLGFGGPRIIDIDLTNNRELIYLATSWSEISLFDLSNNRKMKTLLIDGSGVSSLRTIFGREDNSDIDLDLLSAKKAYSSNMDDYNFYGAEKVFLGESASFTSFDLGAVAGSANMVEFSMTNAPKMSELAGLTQNITTLTLSGCGFEKIDLRAAGNLTKLVLTGNPGVNYGGAIDPLRLYITVTDDVHKNLTNLDYPRVGADLGGGVIVFYLAQAEIDEHITYDFTDPVFRKWVLDTFCPGGATKIYRSDVEGRTQIESTASSAVPRIIGAGSLNGIEHFKALEKLNVTGNTNLIKKIDLRKNTKLTQIFLENGPVANVMTVQPIEELRIEGLSELSTLNVSISTFEALDLSDKTKLWALSLQNAFGIKKVDLRRCKNLSDVNMAITAYRMEPVLEEIDFSQTAAMYTMNLKGQSSLKYINAEGSNVNHFDTTFDGDLSRKGALESINIADCPILLNLILMGGDSFTNIDLSGSPRLTTFTIYNSKITKLDLSKNTNINRLELKDNAIEELDISGNERTLSYLNVTGNPGKAGFVTVYSWFDNNSVPTGTHPITGQSNSFTDPTVPWTSGGSVSVNYLKDVTRFFVDEAFRNYVRTTFCGGRARILTSDLVGRSVITAHGLGLRSISGIEFFPDLTRIYIGNEINPGIKNNVNYADVSKNPKLTTLSMNDQVDGIAEVNLTGCDDLSSLFLNVPYDSKYRLTSLDVAHCKDMTNFQLNGSALNGALDLSNNPNLNYIYMNNGKVAKESPDSLLVINFDNCPRLREIHVMGLHIPIVELAGINSPELYNIRLENCNIEEITLPDFNEVATVEGKLQKITISLQGNKLDLINGSAALHMGKNAPNPFLSKVGSLNFAVDSFSSVTVDGSDSLALIQVVGPFGGGLSTFSIKDCPKLTRITATRSRLKAASTTIENCPATIRVELEDNLLESLNITNLGNHTAKFRVRGNPGDLITNEFVITAPASFSLANIIDNEISWQYPWASGIYKNVVIQ